jgi:hypothetical protein
MRKFSLLIGLLLVCGVAKADIDISESLNKVPGLHQGVGFSVIDNKVNYLTTLDIVSWKGLTLEGGYAGAAKDTGDKIVAVLSYNLWNAKEAGVTLPVLDLVDVRVGAYAGIGRIQIGNDQSRDGNNEFDAGLSATAFNLKF